MLPGDGQYSASIVCVASYQVLGVLSLESEKLFACFLSFEVPLGLFFVRVFLERLLARLAQGRLALQLVHSIL
jgi:hypothetical protein